MNKIAYSRIPVYQDKTRTMVKVEGMAFSYWGIKEGGLRESHVCFYDAIRQPIGTIRILNREGWSDSLLHLAWANFLQGGLLAGI